jgi:hypothetical protein
VPALATALDGAAADPSREAEQLRISLVLALGHIGTPEARASLELHAKGNLSPAERRLTENLLRSPN